MLNAVIRFSLRHRSLIVFVSLALLLYGSYVAAHLPIDVFPDLDRPRVVVMTECPGLAPEEVETLVSFPLEAAFLGATGVQTVRSQSGLGLSVVYVEFDWGANIHVARQTVQERLSSLAEGLPAGVHPQMAPISSIMGQIMHLGVHQRMGPKGGRLTAIDKTPYWAEWVRDHQAGKLTVHFWDAQGKRDTAAWQPLPVSSEGAVLLWTPPPPPRPAPSTDVPPPPEIYLDTMPPVSVPLRQEGKSALTLHDARLAQKQEEGPTEEAEHHLHMTLAGKPCEVVFPSAAQQRRHLRTISDWVVRPRLLKTPGIAQVVVMGGDRKQYQVLVNPAALLTHKVTLMDVEEALRKNNRNASGGFAVQGEEEQPIRILGRLGPEPEKVIAQLREIPVRPGTPPVKLHQVARIVEGAQQKRGDASVNGFPAVVLTVTKQPHVDTRGLTSEIIHSLEELEQSLPANVEVDTNLFQLKRFIDTGVFNVGEAMVIGAVLVLVILFLFLFNFRTTFISLTAIPLSLAVTALVFKLTGWLTGTPMTINVMTLGGIAVAMGELVDDAIVDVENIFRRLKENNNLKQPRPVTQVIYEASVEIRSAIVFGTLMVIMVFIPLFALSGIEGRLFSPLGVAYIVSILASLLVSLTVTPVLSFYLLPQARATHREHDSLVLRGLKALARPLIRFSMAYAGTILVVMWLLAGACGWLLTQLGADFLPPFDEGSVQVNVTLPPGASLEASNKTAALVDAKFRQLQKSAQNPHGEILQFARRTGRAELDEHAEPVGNSEYILTINPESGRHRDEIIQTILKEVKAEVPGVDVEVEQPLAHLISHMLSGVTAQIAIKAYGDDLNQLRQVAEQIKAEIGTVPGVTPPVIEAQQQIDEVHIRLKPEKLAQHGIDRAYVADFISAALKGEEVSQVLEGQRRFDLVVRLDERFRRDFLNMGRLRLRLPGERGEVPLSELAQIGPGSGANAVNRENARRRIVIRCNAQNRDLASVVGDIQGRVRDHIRLPEGYFVEYGGQFESQQRATLLIGVLALLSFVAMFVILFMLYPSARIVLQILNALPMAFIGGVLALALTRQTLTVASMVGFISLGGIAARNGILLVSHYFHLMRYEGEHFSTEMVLRGSLERLAPVLMTALTAGIGLVPLVIAGHQPGREILYPVATVILGGLISSTLCEYLIHPGLFWRFSGQDASRIAHADEPEFVEPVSTRSPNGGHHA